ncbi:GNAT family N-acetyltransferase [Pyxidicoccus fallax]|uniref:GNAT family N-acetyltransferase n=1 Tax=Pyxidicoccus fallax TaxID=394095 RepID=A0A848LQR4_9BACT|nr:GNAT family N-acetyltransferase [Pyxidicoccus fallax]NMO19982.1 GNAT family N-acetyltransferase [Pyxidicoccus fallax]NPC80629.1 GNAT family N-acetyltransferase [Pyxidicoccus fallax]
MTNAELTERLRVNVIAFRHLQRERGQLRHLGLPGVDAFSLPTLPGEAYFQQVYFADAGALSAALPALEDFYRGQGVAAWRVLVPPGHAEGGRLLGGAGYRPDEHLSDAMGLVLDDLPDVPPAIPLETPDTQEDLVAINVATYGDWGGAVAVWNRPPRLPVHTLVAREAGRPLACGFTLDVGDTAGVYMVATAPEARGRGLASEVMRGLLSDARARGMRASVLQATPQGMGVYRRLGYRDLGGWVSWEYRAA